MRAFDPMTHHAGVFGVGDDKAAPHGLYAVHHHLSNRVLTARTVASLALQPILDTECFGPFPGFRISGGGVASQAHSRPLGFFRNATESSDFAGLRKSQGCEGTGVSGEVPAAELVSGVDS